MSARIGLPTSSVYAASKAALLSLARTLSAELLPRGIRVNGLSPGPVETPAFTKTGLSDEALNAMMAEVIKLVPLGRMGSTTELAKAALYLASDESSYTVGTEPWTAEWEVCNSKGADAGDRADVQRRPYAGGKQADGVDLDCIQPEHPRRQRYDVAQDRQKARRKQHDDTVLLQLVLYPQELIGVLRRETRDQPGMPHQLADMVVQHRPRRCPHHHGKPRQRRMHAPLTDADARQQHHRAGGSTEETSTVDLLNAITNNSANRCAG